MNRQRWINFHRKYYKCDLLGQKEAEVANDRTAEIRQNTNQVSNSQFILHISINKIIIYMKNILIKQYFIYFIRKVISLCD